MTAPWLAGSEVDTGTVLESFDSLTNWAVSTGNHSIDTVNFTEGTGGLKLDITAGNTNCFDTKTVNWNISQHNRFSLDVYIPGPVTEVSSIAIYISSSATLVSFFLATFNTGLVQGWNRLTCNRAFFSNTGGEAWTNTIVRFRVRLNGVAGYTPSCTFDKLLYNRYTRPALAWTFDDGWADQYNKGYAYLNAAGMKGTIFINGSLIGTANYCTEAMLATMYAAGWDLANHCINHTNLSTVTTSEAMNLIILGQKWLLNRGYTRAANILAFPNGGYTQDILNRLPDLGIIAARSIIEVNNRLQEIPAKQPKLLKIANLINTVSLATAKSWVDNLEQIGDALLPLNHLLPAAATVSTEWPEADFSALVTYAAAKKATGTIRDVTISQLAKLL